MVGSASSNGRAVSLSTANPPHSRSVRSPQPPWLRCPFTGAVRRISDDVVTFAPRQDHQVAGREPEGLRLPLDFEPGGPRRQEMKRGAGTRRHLEAPRGRHLREAVHRAVDGEPQQELAQSVRIGKGAKTAHHAGSRAGTLRPTIQRKYQAPESPTNAKRLCRPFLVASKSPKESR